MTNSSVKVSLVEIHFPSKELNWSSTWRSRLFYFSPNQSHCRHLCKSSFEIFSSTILIWKIFDQWFKEIMFIVQLPFIIYLHSYNCFSLRITVTNINHKLSMIMPSLVKFKWRNVKQEYKKNSAGRKIVFHSDRTASIDWQYSTD